MNCATIVQAVIREAVVNALIHADHRALYLGIDYSGAQRPTSRLKNLQVYAAQRGGVPQKRFSPKCSNNGQPVSEGWILG